LTSVAAPYHVIQSTSSSTADGPTPLPPLYGPAPGSTISSGTAAAVQDCLDAAQQLLQAPGRTPDTLVILGQLSVRLLLTVPLEGAAVQPGTAVLAQQLLEGSVKLLGSCLAAAEPSSSGVALQAACQLRQAVVWTANTSSSSSSSGAARLPALYSGLFIAAAVVLQASSSGTAESAAAADLVNSAVTEALQPNAGVDCAAAACEALRGLLQEAVAAAAAQQRQGAAAGAAAGGGGRSGRQQLARQCLGVVGPQVSCRQTHSCLGLRPAPACEGWLLMLFLVCCVGNQSSSPQVCEHDTAVISWQRPHCFGTTCSGDPASTCAASCLFLWCHQFHVTHF
jgi:hypothetical protein